MKLWFDSDEGKGKWGSIAGSLAVAAIIAAWIAFPGEIISFGKELMAGKQESKNSSCNGNWFSTCTVTINQPPPVEQHSHPSQFAINKPPEPPASTTVSPTTPQKMNGPVAVPKGKKMQYRPSAFAAADAPIYRRIGPNDDLTLLGIDRFRSSINLCALKKHVPCFMPPGFGRESVVREAED